MRNMRNKARVRSYGSNMAPVTGDAASAYEGNRLMKVVPLQRIRLRGVVPVLTLAVAYTVVARLGL